MKRFLHFFGVFLVLFLLAFPDPSYARRKKSFLGDMVDTFKEGAQKVKEDIRNFNTYVVDITIINESSRTVVGRIYKPYLKGHKPPKTIYVGQVPPKSTRTFREEITASPGFTRVRLEVSAGGNTTGGFFDVSKKDNLTIRYR